MPEDDHGRDRSVDPAAGTERRPSGTLHGAGLVCLGGAAGTAVRAGLDAVIPEVAAVPFGILLINLSGAFLLGLLLAVLRRLGPDVGRRRAVRLLCGTGVLGGYTTYSALAVDTVLLLDGGELLRGIAYSMITVVAGALLSAAGLAAGRAVPPARRDRAAS